VSGLPTASSHDSGLEALLRIRGSNQFESPTGKSLRRQIRLRSQIRALDGNIPVLNDSGNDEIVRLHPPSGVALLRLLSRVSLCCYQMKLVSRESDFVPELDPGKLLEDARLLDFELLSWKDNLSPDLHYQSCTTNGVDLECTLEFPRRLLYFQDILHGAMWLAYWGARMHLLSTHLRTLRDLRTSIVATCSLTTLQERVLDVVHDVCGSAAYMLGEIDEKGRIIIGSSQKSLGAFILTRSLNVAYSMPGLCEVQQKWILERLAHIGHARGIKAALNLAGLDG
jgi:hypothetical protein